MFDSSGRRALVTGAGQNVGRGVARALAAQGAEVAVNDLFADRAEAAAALITRSGGAAQALPFDVTDLEAVRAAISRYERDTGPIDILVNNAGTYGGEQMQLVQFRDSEPHTWERFVAVNLFGVMNCTHAVLGGMCERAWGRVITMSSGAGATGLDIGVAAYGAGKGGSIGFTRHIAMECGKLGVTANSIALGRVVDDEDAEHPAAAGSAPLGLGKPADVGALCVYLASDEAAWMTGQTVQLNGGAVTS